MIGLLGLSLIWAGLNIVASLLRRPELPDDPSADAEVTVDNNSESDPVPVVFGRARVKPRIGWWGAVEKIPIEEVVQSGGLFSRSRKITVGHEIYCVMQMIIAMGPIDALMDIVFDDRSVTLDTTGVYPNTALQISPNWGLPTNRYSGTLTPVNAFPFPWTALLAPGLGQPLQIVARNIHGGRKSGGGFIGPMTFYYGLTPQFANAVLQANIDADVTLPPRLPGSLVLPAWNNICYAVAERMNFGESTNLEVPQFVVQRCPRNLAGTPEGISIGLHLTFYHNIGALGDANPAEVLLELLTNPYYGVGAMANYDIMSFARAAYTFFGEATGISFALDKKTDARSVIEDVLRHVDGVLTLNPLTGLIGLTLQRPAIVGSAISISAANASLVQVNRPGRRGLVNEVKVEFPNKDRQWQLDVEQASDLALLEMNDGEMISETYEYHMFTNHRLAQRKAWHLLKQMRGPIQVTLECSRKLAGLGTGSWVALTFPEENLNGIAFIVSSVDSGTLANGKILIECTEDLFASQHIPYDLPVGNGGEVVTPSLNWYEPQVDVTSARSEVDVIATITSPAGKAGMIGLSDIGIDDPMHTITSFSWYTQTGPEAPNGPYTFNPALIGIQPLILGVQLAESAISHIWWQMEYTAKDGTTRTKSGMETFGEWAHPGVGGVLSESPALSFEAASTPGFLNVYVDAEFVAWPTGWATAWREGESSVNPAYGSPKFILSSTLIPLTTYPIDDAISMHHFVGTCAEPAPGAPPNVSPFQFDVGFIMLNRFGNSEGSYRQMNFAYDGGSIVVAVKDFWPVAGNAVQVLNSGSLGGVGLSNSGSISGTVTAGASLQFTNNTINLKPATTGAIGGVKIYGTPIDPLAPEATTYAQVAAMVAAGVGGGAPPTGAAGGNLSGTYPNPTVAKIQGVAVSSASPASNDTMYYDGTQWRPAGIVTDGVDVLVDSATGEVIFT